MEYPKLVHDKMIVIDNKYEIGQIVYLKTDREQYPRIVTAIAQRQGTVLYELSYGTSDAWHYDFEISVDKDVLITTTG